MSSARTRLASVRVYTVRYDSDGAARTAEFRSESEAASLAQGRTIGGLAARVVAVDMPLDQATRHGVRLRGH